MPQLVATPSTCQWTRSTFKRRSVLPFNVGLWKIERGVVRILTVDEDGTQIVLGLWKAGDIVGTLLSCITPYEIQCLTDVIAYALPSSYCCSPQTLLSHIQQTEELFQIVRSGKIERRLQQFLLWLFRTFGSETNQGWLLELSITHQDIAETIGTTRVTVTRLIGQLQQEGFIDWSKRPRILFHVPLSSMSSISSAIPLS